MRSSTTGKFVAGWDALDNMGSVIIAGSLTLSTYWQDMQLGRGKQQGCRTTPGWGEWHFVLRRGTKYWRKEATKGLVRSVYTSAMTASKSTAPELQGADHVVQDPQTRWVDMETSQNTHFGTSNI